MRTAATGRPHRAGALINALQIGVLWEQRTSGSLAPYSTHCTTYTRVYTRADTCFVHAILIHDKWEARDEGGGKTWTLMSSWRERENKRERKTDSAAQFPDLYIRHNTVQLPIQINYYPHPDRVPVIFLFLVTYPVKAWRVGEKMEFTAEIKTDFVVTLWASNSNKAKGHQYFWS